MQTSALIDETLTRLLAPGDKRGAVLSASRRPRLLQAARVGTIGIGRSANAVVIRHQPGRSHRSCRSGAGDVDVDDEASLR